MPIVKCSASKATPAKGINYIMDPEKVIARGSQGFLTRDPKKMARQMLQTMHLFGKGHDRNERKYYHAKVSFNPSDRPENGGSLTAGKANAFAAEYAKRNWPGREVVWSVQDHGSSIHIHFIVAACEAESGKKLDARDADYRKWKDDAQDLAKEMDLSTLDWREATKKKRVREKQSREPIDETFAEEGLKNRGKTTWKDKLRDIIDDAAGSCRSMDEFKAVLESRGVTLTRCTGQTISYKLGDHRACRGDSLGGDYTMAAIVDMLQHNDMQPVPEEGKEHPGLDTVIGGAESRTGGARYISPEERKRIRELGRLAGFRRSDVDFWCDEAPKATWEEKKMLWERYTQLKTKFWDNYAIQQQMISDEISDAYKRRKRIRTAEWALDPRNRRPTLHGLLVALIYIAKPGDVSEIDQEIKKLKAAQQRLRQEMMSFKAETGEAVGTLRERGLSLDEYMTSIKRMQNIADDIYRKNSTLEASKQAQLLKKAINRKSR